MSFILPIASSILQAASFTVDKMIMSVKKVTYKTYVGISFPLIFIFTLIMFFMFRPPLSWNLFSGWAIYLIIGSVILTILTNLIFYRTLKTEKLNEVEALSLIGQITLVIYSGLFFPDERKPFVILLALLCSASIIWAHWRKGHFQIARKTKLYLFWTIFIAPFAMIMTKPLLESWNPISLQLIRDGMMALVFGPLFLRYEKKASYKAVILLLITNVLTSVAWILYYFSVKEMGVIQTVLIFSIQPLLVYFSSIFLLKEKLHWKKLVCFIIILVSIVLTMIL
jgi:drug/metabolite transporter (DMT)-like permease